MPQPTSHARARRLLWGVGTGAAALAGAAAAVVVGTAAASSFTLHVAKNVHVTNNGPSVKAFRVKAVNTREAVAVGPSGYPVYTFQGETTHHLICHKTSNAATNCWAFWPPVSPSSSAHLSKPSAIKGKLGTFHNHGTLQLTLNGQPLYYFMPDIMSGNKRQAQGDELKTFGSIWHIVVVGRAGSTTPPPTTTTTTTTPGYTMTSPSSGTTTPGY
jgi:predicted lipoprotein with Yx(FWY)xxD motif